MPIATLRLRFALQALQLQRPGIKAEDVDPSASAAGIDHDASA